MLLGSHFSFSFFNFKACLQFGIENFSIQEKILSTYDYQAHKPKI